MAVRLFVGNLAYDVTEAELREFFTAVGSTPFVRIPTDRETGRSRGFAFVEFGDDAHAQEAINRFNQQLFKGRPLAINEARPREERTGPRPAPSLRPSWSDGPPMGDRPPDQAQPRRVFGPDAPPRGKRRPGSYAPKGGRTPKPAVRERPRDRISTRELDLDEIRDEQGGDEVAFWEQDAPADGQEQEKEK